MPDEAMTQADLFLEHAMRDPSVMESMKSGKWADVEMVAKSLNYSFTRQEFRDAAAELLEDELEDEELERISGGLTDDEENDIVAIIGGLPSLVS